MYQQTIYNYHLDGYGHVNNARYLEFLEAARWHYFNTLGINQDLRQAQLVVAHMDIRYRRAVGLDEQIAIDSQIVAVQSRQIQVEQHIYSQNQICVSAKVTLMPTDANGKVFRLPEKLHQACWQHIQAG